MEPIHESARVFPEPITDRCFRVFMCLLLAVYFLLLAPSVYGADPSKVYFVPLPEEQIRLASATFGESGNTIHTIVSISVVAGSTTIYYDHWEDGYEADLSNPVQGTTEAWTLDAGDILTLENDVPANPRGTAIRYDGRDKIGSTQAIAVTRAGWPTDPGTVLAGAVEVFDTSKWGIYFDIPVGEDSPGSSSFEYTGLVVMAAEDGTTVEIDTDADGTVDITETLNMGESYLVNGGLQVGATVSASAAVQVDLVTGDVGARFEGRWFTLIPEAQWTDSYYNPVGTTVSDDPVYTILYNPDTSPITVSYETYPSGSGSFSVPAGGTYEFEMPTDSGAHFYTGGSPFFAICLVDYDGSTHDWGFTLLPESALTTVAAVGWGPGSTDLSVNGSPVWVTSTADTTVYVDYDGDPTTGWLTDPNGSKYDVAYKVNALQSLRVFDNTDNNQTGMRVYTTDGVLITAAYGQDPASAGPASPYLDFGTTVLPVASIIVQKDGVLGNDINGNGFLDAGDTILYTIIINNSGTQTLTDIVVTDDMDPNTPYAPGTSTIFGFATQDDLPPDTPFPFDESGFIIGNLAPGSTATITYQATVVVPLPEGTTSVSNRVTVVTDIETLDDSVQTPIHRGSGLIKQLYLSDPGQSLDRIDPVATSDTSTARSEALNNFGLALDDVTSVSTNDTDTYTITIPHTTGAGDNRLMLVGVSFPPNKREGEDDAIYVGSVTYGASNLINVGTEQQEDKARIEIWALVNPPVGPNNVVVNFWSLKDGGVATEAKNGAVAGVATFTGVDQDTPYGLFNSNVGDSDTPSVTISSAAGELVFDTVDLEKDGDTLSLGPDQSELWRLNDKDAWAGGSTEAGAASVTMSWSFDGDYRDWAIGAISIKPAVGTNTTTFTQTPAMCEDFVMSASNLVGVTAYIEAAQSSGSVTSAVSQSSDDAEEEGPDGTSPGSMYITSSDLELVADIEPATSGTQQVGMRFNDITVPPGATITNAYITFRTEGADSPNTNNNVAELYIEGQAADDPATFTTALNNISSRPRTGAAAKWIPAAWTAGIDYTTPDLSAIAQELVDRAGWANGNSMVFIVTGTGSRTAESWNGSGVNPPELTIQYTTGTLPAGPAITAILKHNGSTIHTFSYPAVTDLGAGINRLEWSDVLLSDITVPDGEQIELEITTTEPGISFEILYDSQDYPSLIEMEADTVISVDLFGAYDAAYPGGVLIDPGVVGQTVYIRAEVSDPFGQEDITSLDLSITDACDPANVTNITLTDTDVVNTVSCGKIYEATYLVPNCGGTYTVVGTANEGTEGVTDSATTTFEVVPDLKSFEPDYATEDNLYYRDPEATGQVADAIYIGSLGFLNNTAYDVAYYDALGNWAYTDTAASTDGSGFLRSTNPNTNDSVAYGTWTAVVFLNDAAIPGTYNSGAPPDDAIIDDTFEVVSWSTATLTDENGNPVTEYQMPDGSGMAYFQIVDADQNTDPNSIETITITVTDSQTEDSETVTLYETGPNTGVFANNASGSRYGLPLSTSTGTGEDDGTLNTYGDSTIHLSYADPNDGEDHSDDEAIIPTLAVIGSFGAYTESGRVVVEWQTVSENGTIGFHLKRLNEKSGAYKRVNKKLMPGLLVSAQGGTYRFMDKKAQPGGTYTYQLVEKEADGGRQIYGPYTVTVDDPDFESQYSADETSESINVDGDQLERKAKKRQKKVKKIRRKKNKRISKKITGRGDLGVNISVSAKGLYDVSAGDVAAALGVSNQKVKKWIKTNKLALTHQGLPVAWQKAPKGSGFYFYGEDIDSPYTDLNVYQLTRGKGKKVSSIDGEGPDSLPTLDGFTAVVHMEEDLSAQTERFDDPNDDYWIWDYLFAGYVGLNERSFTIAAPGLVADTAGTLTTHFKGGFEADHTVAVVVNGTVVGEVLFSGTISHSVTLDVPPGVLTEGANTVTLTAVEPPADTSVVFIDSFDLAYEKAFTALDDQLLFNAEGRVVITVDGFSNGNIQVFDVTDPWEIIKTNAITIEEADDGTYRVSLWTDDPDGRYLALAEPAVKTVGEEDLAAFIAPQLMKTRYSVDYLVITPDELKNEAQSLADYRQGRGLSTLVVLLQDIYDEFNYGIANPEAVRDFLEYVWHNWRKPPRYVVRVGDGSHDYKDTNDTGDTLMPPFMVATPWGLTASENRLADVDGSDDGVPEMMIGLLPADSSQALSDMVDKIIAYEASIGDWKSRVLMVADDPDGGGNFPADSDAVAALVSEDYTTESIYLGDLGLAAARETLSTGIEDGAFLVNYIGHSGLDRLAQEGLLTQTDVDGMTNQDRLPILVGMTCLAGRFEIPGFDAIGESLVVKENGGAVAAWVPTGLSLNHLAQVLDEEFFTAVFADNETVLGDAILSAMIAYKNRYPVGNQFMLDIYTLIGDPALELH